MTQHFTLACPACSESLTLVFDRTNQPDSPPDLAIPAISHLPSLAKRQREIAQLVACGLSNREIADRLFIGVQTVKNHLHNIFQALGLKDRLSLALLVVANLPTTTTAREMTVSDALRQYR